ncbi:MAG: LruC domain-containing protein, partial [Anaerolineaceae bacterium]|nr:LruC domain-containing protein [Anaerolineaceae bacterium]
ESLTISTSGASKIIQGSDDGTSLAKIKTVTVPNYSNFQLLGNLEVECSNYNVLPESGSTVNQNTTGVDVRFVNVGETTVTIPPSDYNKGGNIVTPPETPPADPSFPIIWNGTSVTYLFEDNWPLLGDYDMNDVVMDVTPTYMTNSENKVTQLRLDVVLRALGATKRLAVGLQLDGIYPSMITNVTRSSKVGVNETVFPTDKTKGLENGQTFAVIPIFDIAFEALGKSSPEITNTIKGGGNSGSSMSVPIIVIFNTPVDIESLSIDKFNLFLVNGGYTSSRDEIHLSGYQPTDKANTSKFGAADDNSNSGRLYTSKNNMIWALAIPGSSSYPTEWTSIRLAFPQFQDWVLSGGGSNKTWYNNPDPDLVY